MMKYIYLLKDKNDQMKLIKIIAKDYFENYYNSSYYIRSFYQNGICNFGLMDNDVFITLYNELLSKPLLNCYTNTIIQGKGNKRKMFDAFTGLIKKNFLSNQENKEKYGNVYIYFQAGECSKYRYNLQHLDFTKEKEKYSPILFDTLINYFKDKLSVEDSSQEDLIELVNTFINY